MRQKSPFRKWMSLATSVEKAELAHAVKTAPEYLYQLASGSRKASASMAGRIEEVTARLRKGSKGRLPKITRMDLSKACAGCPYAKKCIRR